MAVNGLKHTFVTSCSSIWQLPSSKSIMTWVFLVYESFSINFTVYAEMNSSINRNMSNKIKLCLDQNPLIFFCFRCCCCIIVVFSKPYGVLHMAKEFYLWWILKHSLWHQQTAIWSTPYGFKKTTWSTPWGVYFMPNGVLQMVKFHKDAYWQRFKSKLSPDLSIYQNFKVFSSVKI